MSALLPLHLILVLTPGFNGLGNGNCKTRRDEKHSSFWDLVRLNIRSFRAMQLYQHIHKEAQCDKMTAVGNCLLRARD